MTGFGTWPEAFVNGWMTLVIAFLLGLALVYLVLMVLGYFALRHDPGRLPGAERKALGTSPLLPRISVVAPARNEAVTIVACVRAMLGLRYPRHEVIVVNDGSDDGTMGLLIEEFRLYRSSRVSTGDLPTAPIRGIYESRDPIPLVVVDKEDGGKADALNAGLNVSRAPLVATVDADTILEPDAMLHVVVPFLDEGGERTLASGGIVRVGNGCRVEHGRVVGVGAPRSILAAFQAVEYMRAFLGGRIAYSFLGSLLVLSGAFAVFRRRAIVEAGGFSTTTVGEDMEIVVRLHRRARDEARERANGRGAEYRIVFVPEPVSWTEAPETFRQLARQRGRWHCGLVETLWTHRRMAFNPRYGVVGTFGFPYFILLEALGPTIELAGYGLLVGGLASGLLGPWFAALFLVVAIGYGTLLSISALVLEELTLRRYPRGRDVMRLFAAAIVENFGVRQMLAVVRTWALIDALRGRSGWDAMDRRGLGARIGNAGSTGGRATPTG